MLIVTHTRSRRLPGRRQGFGGKKLLAHSDATSCGKENIVNNLDAVFQIPRSQSRMWVGTPRPLKDTMLAQALAQIRRSVLMLRTRLLLFQIVACDHHARQFLNSPRLVG